MVKIAKRPFEELIQLLEMEMGDRLRVVLRLGGDGTERLFARSDLASRSNGELGVPLARVFPGSDEPEDLVPRGVGGSDCLVGYLEDVVVVVLYRHTDEAVVIAFDRAREDALAAFVERCQETMRLPI